jgi:O-acetyl-ADP-ribose deacetylase (regulator of RNase III)
MIVEGRGNLLTAEVAALVNTVNTVGVMGKGIALQFKRAFPANYAAYRAACDQGRLQPGTMFVFDQAFMGPRRYVINFPTKRHWKSASRRENIASGLVDLVRVVRDLGVASVAVPALGCGNGGLNWDVVRPMIQEAFEGLPDVRVLVFAPHGAPDPASMPVVTPRPALTSTRATLVAAIARYRDMAGYYEPRVGVSELEIQKIAYLLQVLGTPMRLTFVPAHYGPYAERLHPVLHSMEGHQLIGYGDRSAPVGDLRPIRVTEDALSESKAVLSADAGATARVSRLADLVEGFVTPYSMELLSTVHLVAHQDPPTASAVELTARVSRCSARKARLFTTHHVAVAAARLAEFGLLPEILRTHEPQQTS